MAGLPAKLLPAFRALAPYAELAAAICEAVSRRHFSGPMEVGAVCSAAGLPLARRGDVYRLFEAGAAVGVFRQVGVFTWEPVANLEHFTTLALMLSAVACYRQEVHRDDDTVEVVLTQPPNPSQLEAALLAQGYGTSGLEHTSEIFTHMAAQAERRFTVMTPFLDDAGAQRLVNLFSRVQLGVRKEFIMRFLDYGVNGQ